MNEWYRRLSARRYPKTCCARIRKVARMSIQSSTYLQMSGEKCASRNRDPCYHWSTAHYKASEMSRSLSRMTTSLHPGGGGCIGSVIGICVEVSLRTARN